MQVSLQHYLVVSSVLFCLGLFGVIARRNLLIIYMSLELMLNAANLNFLAFWRFGPNPEALSGVMVVIFSIAIAAAEAAVGLALIVNVYRHFKSTDLTVLDSLKG